MSEEDFVGHHANLSFGVPSDAQFHQLISNCWGLDDQNAADQNRVPQTDGTMPIDADIAGLAGNSNLRKFLVSYADGSQSVEELTFPSEVREVEGGLDCCVGRLLLVTLSPLSWTTPCVTTLAYLALQFLLHRVNGVVDAQLTA